MNLQSNALKFTKDGGTIKIIVELVKRFSSRNTAKRIMAPNFADFSSSSSESHNDSVNG